MKSDVIFHGEPFGDALEIEKESDKRPQVPRLAGAEVK
jgi:hypothetical protein